MASRRLRRWSGVAYVISAGHATAFKFSACGLAPTATSDTETLRVDDPLFGTSWYEVGTVISSSVS